MRRSFKWILGLVPVAAGSVGTAIYLTSENSISSLNEVNLDRQNVQVETRIAPLASSQDAKTNTKNELISSEKPTENASAPKKIIVPNLSELPSKSESNPKSNSEQKQRKTPIILGQIPIKDEKIAKKVEKLDSRARSNILIYQPKPKNKTEEKKSINANKPDLVAIASNKSNLENKKVEPPKSDLPIKTIIAEMPNVKTMSEKLKQSDIKSQILAPEEVKPGEEKVEKTLPQILEIVPQVADEEEKRKEREKQEQLKKQQEEQTRLKLEEEKQEKLLREQEEKEQIKKEEERRKQEEIKKEQERRKKEELERKQQEEIKREEAEKQRRQQEEAERQKKQKEQEAQLAAQNSSGTKISSGDTAVDNIIEGIQKDFGKVNADKLLEKYKFSSPSQLETFLNNVPVPKTETERANLITFWVLSNTQFNPHIAAYYQKEWREMLYKKLKLKTEATLAEGNRISQGNSFRVVGK